MVKIISSIFIFTLLFGHSSAQQTDGGKIVFTILPFESIVQIDDSVFYGVPSMQILNSGKHEIKIWSPMHDLVDTTVEIIRDSLITLRIFLRYSDEYRDFLNEKMKKYQNSVFKLVILPKLSFIPEIAFFTSTATIAKGQAKKNSGFALHQSSIYNSVVSPSAIDSARNSFEKYRRKYNRNVTTVNGCYVGLMITTLFLLYWNADHQIQFSKIVRPVFIEEPKLTFIPGTKTGNFHTPSQFGLSFKF